MAESLLEFPCSFPIKIMGRTEDGFAQLMLDIVLRNVIDYSPAGLTSTNQRSVGNAINAIQSAQASPAFAPLATALFFQPNAKALGSAYDSLSGSETSGTQQLSFTANDMFMSTPRVRARSGGGRRRPSRRAACSAAAST